MKDIKAIIIWDDEPYLDLIENNQDLDSIFIKMAESINAKINYSKIRDAFAGKTDHALQWFTVQYFENDHLDIKEEEHQGLKYKLTSGNACILYLNEGLTERTIVPIPEETVKLIQSNAKNHHKEIQDLLVKGFTNQSIDTLIQLLLKK